VSRPPFRDEHNHCDNPACYQIANNTHHSINEFGRDYAKDSRIDEHSCDYRHVNKTLTFLHATKQIGGRLGRKLISLDLLALNARIIGDLRIGLLQVILNRPNLGLVAVLPLVGMVDEFA